MQPFLREIIVWRTLSDTEIIRYRCLQWIPFERYTVKAAEHHHAPLQAADVSVRDDYFIESLFYGGLTEFAQTDWAETLEQAIDAFDSPTAEAVVDSV